MTASSTEALSTPSDVEMLEGLFGKAGSDVSTEAWQVARKAGHVLVMARPCRGGLALALRWYRALRPAGRAFRGLLTAVSESAGWRLLPTLKIAPGSAGFIATYERETGRQITTILFGNPVQGHRRAILRSTRAGEPDQVVKVGFSRDARAAIARERRALEIAGPLLPEVSDSRSTDDFDSFAIEEIAGAALDDATAGLGRAVSLLRTWTRFSESRALAEFEDWGRVARGWQGEEEALQKRLAPLRLCPALSHGDFAAWNLLVAPGDGGLRAIDWEWADPAGVPGWDIVHYLCQSRAMVGRLDGMALVEATLGDLRRAPVASFLTDCGWPTPESAFATYACALNPIFRGPEGEALKSLCGRV